MMPSLLHSLAERVSSVDVSGIGVVAGFDAFIDELTHVVASRSSPDAYVPMRSLKDFGAWASAAAGRSGLREAVVTEVGAGGCALNLGDGLAALGFPVTACLGTGTPAHAAFGPTLARFARTLPFPSEPGRTAAYEFSDGKLMLCSVSHFAAITADRLRSAFADGAFRAAVASASALVLTSWSVYPHMTECWRLLQEETLADLPNRPRIFIDIADPASRTHEELLALADTLAGFERIGPTLLSLNGNEASQLAGALGRRPDGIGPAAAALSEFLQDRLGVGEVSVHLVERSCLCGTSGRATIEGPYCERPARTVGAGDRFNAGLLAGTLLGLSPWERLALASATSGFFVRQARSGTLPELAAFLRDWASGSLDR